MRKLINKVYESENKADAEENLKNAISFIDRITTKGILHKNTAARQKSKLTQYVNNL